MPLTKIGPRLLGKMMGSAVSEVSLVSLWDLQADVREVAGHREIWNPLVVNLAVVNIQMAIETREVGEVSLETKENKKSFKKAGVGIGI